MSTNVKGQTTICQRHREPATVVKIMTRRRVGKLTDEPSPLSERAAIYHVTMDCGHGGQRVMVR